MKTMRHILVVPALAAMLTGGAIISEARSLDTITLDCVFEHQNTSNVTDGKLTRDSNAQKPLSFTITGLDGNKRRATMVGSQGSTPLLFLQ
jgi:hypothetical protein